MRDYRIVLLFAAMPALGNFAVGLLAELCRPSRRALNLALHAAAFTVPIFFGATVGFWGMRGVPKLHQLMLLSFTAGALTRLVVEELVLEAHETLEEGEGRLAPLFFVGGFALSALISAYLE